MGASATAAGRSRTRWRNAAVVFSSIGVSAIAGIGFLATVYGFAPLVSALLQANRTLLVMAAGVGVVVLTIRAKRATVLLSRQRRVRMTDAFSAMVVGNGIGDLLPIVPCGVALRCFLTKRLSSVSVAYSAGVFMLEGVLDGLGLALLSGFLLLTMQLPAWVRVLLLATAIQALLSFAVPVVVQLVRRSARISVRSGWMARLLVWGGDVGGGLTSGLSGGRDRVLSVGCLSLLIPALAGLQLVLLLTAFGLSTSPDKVLLILVLSLAAGNLPINLPGSGTVSTVAALQIAGIHGAGVAGFVLMSRAVLSSEVMLMACGSLVRWTVTGRVHDLRVGTAFQSLYQMSWLVAVRRGRAVGRRLGHISSKPARALAALQPRP